MEKAMLSYNFREERVPVSIVLWRPTEEQYQAVRFPQHFRSEDDGGFRNSRDFHTIKSTPEIDKLHEEMRKVFMDRRMYDILSLKPYPESMDVEEKEEKEYFDKAKERSLKSDIVITIGEEAKRAFIGDRKISEGRAEVLKCSITGRNKYIIVLPELDKLKGDIFGCAIKRLPAILNGTFKSASEEMKDSIVARTYQDFKDWAGTHDLREVAYDIETNAASPYSSDFEIIGFSLAVESGKAEVQEAAPIIGINNRVREGLPKIRVHVPKSAVYVNLKSLDYEMEEEDRVKSLELLRRILERAEGVTVHNCLYELPATLYQLGYDIPYTKLTDTLVMAKLKFGGKRLGAGLKQNAQSIGYEDWETDLQKYTTNFQKALTVLPDEFNSVEELLNEEVTEIEPVEQTQTRLNLFFEEDVKRAKIKAPLRKRSKTQEYLRDYITELLKVIEVYYSADEMEELKSILVEKFRHAKKHGIYGNVIPYNWIPSRMLEKYGATDALATVDLRNYYTRLLQEKINNVNLAVGYQNLLKEHYTAYKLMIAGLHWDRESAERDRNIYESLALKSLKYLLKSKKLQEYLMNEKTDLILPETVKRGLNGYFEDRANARVVENTSGGYQIQYLDSSSGKLKNRHIKHLTAMFFNLNEGERVRDYLNQDDYKFVKEGMKEVLNERIEKAESVEELTKYFNPRSPKDVAASSEVLFTDEDVIFALWLSLVKSDVADDYRKDKTWAKFYELKDSIHYSEVFLKTVNEMKRSMDDGVQIILFDAMKEMPLSPDEYDTWTDSFKWLLNFRIFKKSMKMIGSYLDGKIGEESVRYVNEDELKEGGYPERHLQSGEGWSETLSQTDFKVAQTFTGRWQCLNEDTEIFIADDDEELNQIWNNTHDDYFRKLEEEERERKRVEAARQEALAKLPDIKSLSSEFEHELNLALGKKIKAELEQEELRLNQLRNQSGEKFARDKSIKDYGTVTDDVLGRLDNPANFNEDGTVKGIYYTIDGFDSDPEDLDSLGNEDWERMTIDSESEIEVEDTPYDVYEEAEKLVINSALENTLKMKYPHLKSWIIRVSSMLQGKAFAEEKRQVRGDLMSLSDFQVLEEDSYSSAIRSMAQVLKIRSRIYDNMIATRTVDGRRSAAVNPVELVKLSDSIIAKLEELESGESDNLMERLKNLYLFSLDKVYGRFNPDDDPKKSKKTLILNSLYYSPEIKKNKNFIPDELKAELKVKSLIPSEDLTGLNFTRRYSISGNYPVTFRAKPAGTLATELYDSKFLVLSYDHYSDKLVPAVAKVKVTGMDVPQVQVNLSNGTSFKCTPEHLLLNSFGMYTKAKDSAGVPLMAGTETISVESVTELEERAEFVYDLTVPKYHNFLLRNGIIVHNSGFHTLPANSTMKNLFNSRFKGGTILQPDFSQNEIRCAASYANEQTMLQAFKEGKDIHQANAAAMYHIPYDEVTKDQRRIAKGFSFSILYGSTARSIADTYFDGDLEEAQRQLDNFYQTFPRLELWMRKKRREARKDAQDIVIEQEVTGKDNKKYTVQKKMKLGYVSTFTDRLIEIMWDDEDKRSKAARDRTAVNYVIQSFHYDSEVLTADGKVFKIGELADYQIKNVPVLSYDVISEKVQVSEGLYAQCTGFTDTWQVLTLTNGQSVKVTPEHLMMMSSGDYRRADKIRVGDELMSLDKDNPVQVQTVESEQVNHEPKYDLSVPKYYNFALKSGIFVHNSAASTVAALTFHDIITHQESLKLKTKPVCFIHDSLESDVYPYELLQVLEYQREALRDFAMREFKLALKADISMGVTLGEECELKEFEILDEAKTKARMKLKGFKLDVERLTTLWRSVYFKVDLEEFNELDSEFVTLDRLFMPKTAFNPYIWTEKVSVEVVIYLQYFNEEGQIEPADPGIPKLKSVWDDFKFFDYIGR